MLLCRPLPGLVRAAEEFVPSSYRVTLGGNDVPTVDRPAVRPCGRDHLNPDLHSRTLGRESIRVNKARHVDPQLDREDQPSEAAQISIAGVHEGAHARSQRRRKFAAPYLDGNEFHTAVMFDHRVRADPSDELAVPDLQALHQSLVDRLKGLKKA